VTPVPSPANPTFHTRFRYAASYLQTQPQNPAVLHHCEPTNKRIATLRSFISIEVCFICCPGSCNRRWTLDPSPSSGKSSLVSHVKCKLITCTTYGTQLSTPAVWKPTSLPSRPPFPIGIHLYRSCQRSCRQPLHLPEPFQLLFPTGRPLFLFRLQILTSFHSKYGLWIGTRPCLFHQLGAMAEDDLCKSLRQPKSHTIC
jgi:hypothetical protein